jgi:plastocyanin
MRPFLAQWSSQLFDALSRVPPWTPLPHRRRGRAAGRPSTLTRVPCRPRRSCPHGATVHGSCSRQRRRWGAALAAGVLLTGLVSVPGAMAAQAAPSPIQAEVATAAATAPQVTVEQAMFGPATLTIRAGTTVTWVNHDGDLHTVTSTQGLFASPGLDAGDTFAYRFTAPGTYPYFCALHPHMHGTIIVQ